MANQAKSLVALESGFFGTRSSRRKTRLVGFGVTALGPRASVMETSCFLPVGTCGSPPPPRLPTLGHGQLGSRQQEFTSLVKDLGLKALAGLVTDYVPFKLFF